jgi:hypothetical protein
MLSLRGQSWRCFSREAIKARNDNLDIAWLRDTEAESEEQLTEPQDIAAAIIGHLKAALEDIETLSDELEPDTVDEAIAGRGRRMSALPAQWAIARLREITTDIARERCAVDGECDRQRR